MIQITITRQLTGKKGLLYEFAGRQGRRTYVPTYVAFVCLGAEKFDFAVTRDSSFLKFGNELENLYGEKGECPPSAETPYSGVIREDGSVGFRVEFFEDPDTRTLLGQGGVPRKHIQIHFGAAASDGCILVAGRRRLYRRNFEKPLRAMLKQSNTIQVIVESR